MKPVVYIDMLFMLNFTMNSAVIFATAVLLQKEIHIIRTLAVSSASALYSAVMFFPQISFLYSAIAKIIFWLITAYAAFPEKKISALLRNALTYLSANLIFGGTIFFLIFRTDFGTLVGSVVSNGEIYLNISFGTLLISAVTAYSAIYTIAYIKRQRIIAQRTMTDIQIFVDDRHITVNALCDTGCTLTDPISGYPAIIISSSLAKKLISSEIPPEKSRILPYSTIDCKKGVLQGFIPHKVVINDRIINDVVIAISDNPSDDYSAIFNYKLMETYVSGKAVNKIETETTV